MKKKPLFFTFCIVIILLPTLSYSQYILNGNARQESCNCYLLTDSSQDQIGSVWQSIKINLENSFDFSFNVYLGCEDKGADGIVFILQTDSNSIGASGQGLGFQGITPSIGISLDTYQNFSEPAFDHISIETNGNNVHSNSIAGPIPASSVNDNIEDCNWHIFRIKWDASTHTLSTYFDGVFRLSAQKDLVTTIFNNNPLVYWGFSGSTGSQFNIQKFCTPLNSDFNTNFSNNATCFGTSVIFKDSSLSFSTIQSYYWDFGDSMTSIKPNPPPHNYSQPGIYLVEHSITAADGCTSKQVIKTIIVSDKPNISFNIYDTCRTISPRLENNTKVNVGWVSQWKWQLDGNSLSNIQNPDLSNLSPGNHSISLIATSNYGCTSNALTKNFNIKDIPDINITVKDGCVNKAISFIAQKTDSLTTINSWYWNFGDGLSSYAQNTDHSYAIKGIYSVELIVGATNGCNGYVSKTIRINRANAFAGKDTVVLKNTPFFLHGSGGNFYTWSPATGLSNPNISNPVGNATDNITYSLTVETLEGCIDTSSIRVTVFKGSAIYVPTGFTPNNDGRNDILKPTYFGIKSLSYFTIYNRWGQKVFSTNNMNTGWNGSLDGPNSDTGSFVWILRATDLIGKIYNLKGVFTLLR